MSRNLIARIAVAAVAIPVILWICYQGGLWLLGMIALFALIAMTEYLIAEGHTPRGIIYWATLLFTAVYFALILFAFLFLEGRTSIRWMDGSIFLATALAVLLLPAVYFILSAMLLAFGKRSPAELFATATRLVWGVIYICWLYPVVFLLGAHQGIGSGVAASGGDILLFLFAVLWVGDTSAMFSGMKLGRHKLAPTVSPNKTVEGFVGGLLGAALVGLILYFWLFRDSIDLHHVLIMAIGSSLFGQLGDLVESMWKRSLGIKDSSAIIPGHGGVLDRFDSLLFGAPFMFAYLMFVVPSY
ncbi:hypothetical protein GF420_06210 [candidate division GN15 bacterium]|nr:hypothetical protein [candidate division GN15 bacterium]